MLSFFKIIANNWSLALFITFCFWPGLMFLVGWIGESRLIPMGEKQSKAFFPGDFAFGIMFVCLAIFYAKASEIEPDIVAETLETPGWVGFSAVVAFILFFFLRRKDRFAYPKRAFNSPTKICHDVVGFLLIPFMLIWMEYPALSLFARSMWFKRTPDLSNIRTPIELIVLAWLLYIFCLWKDATDARLAEKARYMHTAYWRPLWQKTK